MTERDYIWVNRECRICGTPRPFPLGQQKDGYGNPAPLYWNDLCSLCLDFTVFRQNAFLKWQADNIESARQSWCEMLCEAYGFQYCSFDDGTWWSGREASGIRSGYNDSDDKLPIPADLGYKNFETYCSYAVFTFPTEEEFNKLICAALVKLSNRKRKYGQIGLLRCQVKTETRENCPHWATKTINGIPTCGYHIKLFSKRSLGLTRIGTPIKNRA